MRYNDTYFDFALTPQEAETLYRELNARLNDAWLEAHERATIERFRQRIIVFIHEHPCKYGREALL